MRKDCFAVREDCLSPNSGEQQNNICVHVYIYIHIYMPPMATHKRALMFSNIWLLILKMISCGCHRVHILEKHSHDKWVWLIDHEWMNCWTNELLNGWIDDGMNCWMGEWMHVWLGGIIYVNIYIYIYILYIHACWHMEILYDPSARPQTEFLCKPIWRIMQEKSITRNHGGGIIGREIMQKEAWMGEAS